MTLSRRNTELSFSSQHRIMRVVNEKLAKTTTTSEVVIGGAAGAAAPPIIGPFSTVRGLKGAET